jgi:exodeoxyribonuclease VII large subunit
VRPLTVAEVVWRIRGVIEREFPSAIWVEGEVSNCSYPASGHIYFSLVDEHATDRFGQRLVLPCVFFRGANQSLRFKLTDGLKVLCFGQVTTFEGRGQYQLKILRVEPKGIGALQLAFEQLKARLAAEGLFAEARKRPIPRLPSRIGIITSASGSAIHDMVSQLRGHFDVVILPAKVQGEGAWAELVEAIDLANALRLADVLIVGRGGGSVEDLWAFNEEPVARAIARSHIPVISAVGHQDDWTIADYVADLRPSTPTDAAKWLVHEQHLFIDQCRELVQRLVESTHTSLDEQTNAVEVLRERLRLLHPVHQLSEYVRLTLQWHQQLVQSMRHALAREELVCDGRMERREAMEIRVREDLSALPFVTLCGSIPSIGPDHNVGMLDFFNQARDVDMNKVQERINLEPQNPEVYWTRAELYRTKGLFDLSVNDYEKALSLGLRDGTKHKRATDAIAQQNWLIMQQEFQALADFFIPFCRKELHLEY